MKHSYPRLSFVFSTFIALAQSQAQGVEGDSVKSSAAAQSESPRVPSVAPATVLTPSGAYVKRRQGGGPVESVRPFRPPVPAVLSAQEALKTFKLPPGFKIEAVASEPLVESPVAISWDAKGRMYVVEMIGYMPDMEADGEDRPVGRIKRLEDTKGNGTCDMASVFVDHLVMPQKLEQPINLGRIYRIVPDGSSPKVVTLPSTPKELVQSLAHPNGWVRDNAQRIIVEQGDRSVVDAMEKLFRNGPALQTRVQALLTYVRREWQNDGTAVKAAEVAKVRAQIAGRTTPWTAGELMKAVR